jgi:hypothetical protein
MLNLDDPIVIQVAAKSRQAVCRHFVLKVHVRHRGTNVMRVKVFFSSDMMEFDTHPGLDKFDGFRLPVVFGIAL